jgi:hypothetical protein
MDKKIKTQKEHWLTNMTDNALFEDNATGWGTSIFHFHGGFPQ